MRKVFRVDLAYDGDSNFSSQITRLQEQATIHRVFRFERDFEAAFPPEILASAITAYLKQFKNESAEISIKDVNEMLAEPKPFVKVVAERYLISIDKPYLGDLLAIELLKLSRRDERVLQGAGEGNLKTEVVDVDLLEVPNPKGLSAELRSKLSTAFASMQARSVGRLVEEQLMDCHSPEKARKIADGAIAMSTELKQPDRRALDEAVFEALGVTEFARRAELVAQLHYETALHFRQIRVVEVQKMEQRKKAVARKFSAEELAEDLWDAVELEDFTPLKEWVKKQPGISVNVTIPDSYPAQLSTHSIMFDNETVYFGKDRKKHVVFESRDQAELVKLLSDLHVHGDIALPSSASGAAQLKGKIEERISHARARFEELAHSRTSLEEKQDEIVDLLLQWFVLGTKMRAESPA
jgi:hypothetical protein